MYVSAFKTFWQLIIYGVGNLKAGLFYPMFFIVFFDWLFFERDEEWALAKSFKWNNDFKCFSVNVYNLQCISNW